MIAPTKTFDILSHPIAYLLPEVLSGRSGWIEHIPFAACLIELLRPATLVELGTFHGDSYFAFCQIIQNLSLPTRCFAIDHWQGDEHAGALNPQTILAQLQKHHATRYADFSQLIQSSFDDALARFQDASIDLLHIDGLHTYEAVKHDYESWLPKLSPRGVLLFHDTNVRRDAFGVHQLWSEISPHHPHFEFLHAQGLGILAPGPNVPQPVLELLTYANENPTAFRSLFETLGTRLTFYQAMRIFTSQTLAQYSLFRQWSNLTGQPTKLDPAVTESIIAQLPLQHSSAITRRLQDLLNQLLTQTQ